jgi:hypothetical protein
MSLRDDPEIQRLAAHSDELRRLLQEHAELDKKVTALDKRHVRTPAEEMERKQLSKHKLASRDRIARLAGELKKQFPA